MYNTRRSEVKNIKGMHGRLILDPLLTFKKALPPSSAHILPTASKTPPYRAGCVMILVLTTSIGFEISEPTPPATAPIAESSHGEEGAPLYLQEEKGDEYVVMMGDSSTPFKRLTCVIQPLPFLGSHKSKG